MRNSSKKRPIEHDLDSPGMERQRNNGEMTEEANQNTETMCGDQVRTEVISELFFLASE
jgi:hypothetical protein